MKIALGIVALALTWSARAQEIVTSDQYGQTFTQPVAVVSWAPIVFYRCRFELAAGTELTVGLWMNVTCTECTFEETGSPPYGVQAADGIHALGVAKLYLYNCHFDGLRIGVYENGYWLGGQDLFYWACSFSHNNLRYSDGQGGWLNSSWWGGGVEFQKTRSYNYGTHHFEIANCTFTNTLGIDEPGDQISSYEAQGLICANNRIEGGRGQYGDYSRAAAGITTDDEWCEEGAAGNYDLTTWGNQYLGNILVDAQINILAGHDNVFDSNTVINTEHTVTGRPISIDGITRWVSSEGLAWAQTQVVTNSHASSYVDQAGGVNWTNNVSF
jgi:hypothetical protein